MSDPKRDVLTSQSFLPERAETEAQTKRRGWHFPSASWRFCVVAGAISSLVVCTINLAITTWAAFTYEIDEKGQGMVYEGQCSTVRKYNIVIHLAINAFATVLLGASNYCMQCLSAPTRAEIDSAHAKKIWLDIGVPSFRNLAFIKKKRVVLWWLLALTSIPLHLLYNSTFYSSVNVNDYNALIAHMDSGVTKNWTNPTSSLEQLYDNAQYGKLEELNVAQCFQEYASLPRTRGNVVFVVNGTSSNEALIDTIPFNVSVGCGPLKWLCLGYCSSSKPCNGCSACESAANRGNWSLHIAPLSNGLPIKTCFSEKTEERCKIFFSLHLAIVVIVANALKIALFSISLFEMKHAPLLNLGDAIVSFMNRPDANTKGLCLTGRKDFGNKKEAWEVNNAPRLPLTERTKWSKSLSRRKWGFFLVPLLGGVGGCLFLLLYAVGYGQDFQVALMTGFGSVDVRALIGGELSSKGASGVIGNVLLANVGQAFLSIFYVSYNSLLTSLLSAHEWNHYACNRKGLRVSSNPLGAQRSTYFLQLPYRYGVPFQATWGLLHWLVSQSIYLVSLETFRTTGESSPTYMFSVIPTLDEDGDNQLLTCGYSPLGLGATLLCGIVAIICLKVLSRRRFLPGMPVAGSCSAAISATCHASEFEAEDATTLPLQWGALDTLGHGIGHCAFSSGEVEAPEARRRYA